MAMVLAAIALFLQTLSILAPAAHASAGGFADLKQPAGLAAADFVLCGAAGDHRDSGTPGLPDHSSGDCFLCQIFGHALLPLPLTGCVASLRDWRLTVTTGHAGDAAPAAAPDLAGRPRGPPAKA